MYEVRPCDIGIGYLSIPHLKLIVPHCGRRCGGLITHGCEYIELEEDCDANHDSSSRKLHSACWQSTQVCIQCNLGIQENDEYYALDDGPCHTECYDDWHMLHGPKCTLPCSMLSIVLKPCVLRCDLLCDCST